MSWKGNTIKPIEQRFQVNYSYTVYFGKNIFLAENPLLRDIIAAGDRDLPKKLLFFIDEGVHLGHPQLLPDLTAYCRHHAGTLKMGGEPLVLTGGEQIKNDPGSVFAVQRELYEAGLCRHSYIVVIGGGAVLDMVGYAAATMQRGMRLIRVPTTVLAQADAGLGVKNGINAFGRKNVIGTFAPPWAVLNDSLFLGSLSPRDWISGLAEAVKVALIKDAAFFAFIEDQADALRERDLTVTEQVIQRCAALHLSHIADSGDPFESGSSRPLDFGHWSAHKLEQLSAYRLRHGEAVAVGMALDATYSHLAGWLSSTQWQRILRTLLRLGFQVSVPELNLKADVVAGLAEFREHLGGLLTIMLLQDIGIGMEVHALDQGLIVRAMARLQEFTGEAAA